MVTVAEFNRSQRAKSVNQPGFGSIASNQGGGPAGMTFGEAASVQTPSGGIMSQQGAQQAQAIIDQNERATAGGETAFQLRKRFFQGMMKFCLKKPLEPFQILPLEI